MEHLLPIFALAEESLDLVFKAASEADQLEADLLRAQTEVVALRKQAAAPRRTFDMEALNKLAQELEDGDMLPEGLTAEKLAAGLQADPDRLIEIATRLLCPVAPQGKPVKSAAEANPNKSPGTPKTVLFKGRQVIDHDGWLNALV